MGCNKIFKSISLRPKKPLEMTNKLSYNNYTKKAPTPKWMPTDWLIYLSMRGAHPGCRRGGHYFFAYLFLLSRKVSNAMIIPPEDISKANIPRKIIMIS